MKIEVHKTCEDFDSYRAARVKSLFNAKTGARFDLEAELPIDDSEWSLGVIVGPSGSGKTSIGKELWGGDAFWEFDDWPADRPIVDAIAPDGDFDTVTGALSSVGLGTVPTWLRPYPVISNGEKFRANLARIICEAPERVVIDEFTSVVDRQIAKFGSLAFAKSWRRLAKEGGNQCVLLSCHYDIIDWLEPDWVFDTATGCARSGRWLWRRPRIELELWETDWRYWPLFEPHHYLKLPRMIAATCYVGAVEGEPVAHVAVSTRSRAEARACRLVIMPEWQGAGIGTRFLNAVCDRWRRGLNRYGRPMPTLFHTSHPGLAAALRRDPKWCQVSAHLYGQHKGRSQASLRRAKRRRGEETSVGSGFGGHFRAVQGFRYLGE